MSILDLSGATDINPGITRNLLTQIGYVEEIPNEFAKYIPSQYLGIMGKVIVTFKRNSIQVIGRNTIAHIHRLSELIQIERNTQDYINSIKYEHIRY